MTFFKFLQILVVVAGISGGQVLFKISSRDMTLDANFWKIFLNPYLLAALVLYGGCTILWVYLLKDIPLNKAYPVISLSFLIVPLLSWAMLGEEFTRYMFLGAILIMGGIYLMSFQN